jgi:hypothetical protein
VPPPVVVPEVVPPPVPEVVPPVVPEVVPPPVVPEVVVPVVVLPPPVPLPPPVLPEAPPAVLQASIPNTRQPNTTTEAKNLLGVEKKAELAVRFTSIFLTVFFITEFFSVLL